MDAITAIAVPPLGAWLEVQLLCVLGWGLAFRGWSGVVIALLLLVPLIPRIRSEERLLRAHFGAEYDAYLARTWRLIPGIY